MGKVMVQMVVTAVALTAWSGCKDEPNPCDSTSYYDGQSCMPKLDAAVADSAVPVPDAAPVVVEDAEASEAGVVATAPEAGASEASSGGTAKFGDPCTDSVTNAECQGPGVDYCAIQPGSAGYCTKAGCAVDADCPTGWTCFDLSKIGVPGYPPMCAKPRG